MNEEKKTFDTMGLDGNGVDLVILDSGIDPHPDFDGRIISFVDFVHGRKECYDDYGHGTHVAGIAAGSGKMSKGRYTGYAPGARLHVLKVLDRNGNGSRSAFLRALSWIEDNYREKHLRILNFSVGTISGDRRLHNELIRSVERMVSMGLIVIAAAGNAGPRPGSVTAPGSSRKVLTVGASDMLSSSMPFSGRGPTAECICKPEIVFPGKQVMACAAFSERKGFYCEKSGTSMSSAGVSGVVACLLQREPWLTNKDVKLRAMRSARDLGYPVNVQGWGRLDVKQFLENV